MASVLALLEAYNRRGAAALGFFPCAAAPYTRDILLIIPQAGLLQIPLPGFHAEVGLQLVHLVVGNGIDQRQVGDLHVNFSSLFGGFNESEGLVQILARAVDAVLCPDDEAGGAHVSITQSVAQRMRMG